VLRPENAFSGENPPDAGNFAGLGRPATPNDGLPKQGHQASNLLKNQEYFTE